MVQFAIRIDLKPSASKNLPLPPNARTSSQRDVRRERPVGHDERTATQVRDGHRALDDYRLGGADPHRRRGACRRPVTRIRAPEGDCDRSPGSWSGRRRVDGWVLRLVRVRVRCRCNRGYDDEGRDESGDKALHVPTDRQWGSYLRRVSRTVLHEARAERGSRRAWTERPY